MENKKNNQLEGIVWETEWTTGLVREDVTMILDSRGEPIYAQKYVEDIAPAEFGIVEVDGLFLYHCSNDIKKVNEQLNRVIPFFGRSSKAGYVENSLPNTDAEIFVRVHKIGHDEEQFCVPLDDIGLIKEIFYNVNSKLWEPKDPNPYLVKGIIIEGLDNKKRLYVKGFGEEWSHKPNISNDCNGYIEPFGHARILQKDIEEAYKRL
jgi:hypothetical protein